MAGFQHDVDEIAGSGKHRLDRAVAPVADPSAKSVELRLVLRPGAKAHALDESMDENMDITAFGHLSSAVGVAGIPVASGIIVVEGLDDTLPVLGSTLLGGWSQRVFRIVPEGAFQRGRTLGPCAAGAEFCVLGSQMPRLLM